MAENEQTPEQQESKTKTRRDPIEEQTQPVSCQPIATQRNHYFTGKLMAARDFIAESDYFLSHARLHNRLLHGWGIVCGLGVEEHGSSDCKDRWICIQPGIALDCCGRELIVEREMCVELPLPPEDDDKGKNKNKDKVTQSKALTPAERESLPPPFLVVLRYQEKGAEFVPALYAEGCEPTHREPNRIKECVAVEFKLPEELPGCWKQSGGDIDAPCHDDCGDSPAPGGCLEPACACGDYIPVALIRYKDPANPKAGWEIDLSGRREFPPPAGRLTQIVYTNWKHGQDTALEDLRYGDGYALVVKFNRAIKPADGLMTGVSPYTITVEQMSEGTSFKRVYDPDDGLVYLADDGYTAVYEFTDRDFRGRNDILNNTLLINIKCDFILDCNDHAVDGNHLRGRLPTGDGVEGGLFESWTRIRDTVS
ncbi:MAG: hypothetical protein KC547_11070, partial [Anaerolineae bacterium]|nr:hypothetical protein [Anaerolineae bacterium]